MLELVRVNNEKLARQLAHVLGREGIRTREEAGDGEFVLFLEDPARHDEARRISEAFLRDPGARRWQDNAWQASEPVTGLPRQQVLVVTALIYASPYVIGPDIYYALMFPQSLDGLAAQPWRLFSPMLLHFSVLHIIFNLLWWSDLGRLIERFQSSFQLVWITLLVAAVSNLAQFMDTGPRFGGLSGVVYGLLGYLWLYGKTNPAAGYQLRREIVILMLVWLVICYVGLADIVANAAHLSGLITGAALGAGIGLYRRARHYKGV
jgi:GlpG protein